jgi:hypothetical protein
MVYREKYLKYKNKYLQLKKQYGGVISPEQMLLQLQFDYTNTYIKELFIQSMIPSKINFDKIVCQQQCSILIDLSEIYKGLVLPKIHPSYGNPDDIPNAIIKEVQNFFNFFITNIQNNTLKTNTFKKSGKINIEEVLIMIFDYLLLDPIYIQHYLYTALLLGIVNNDLESVKEIFLKQNSDLNLDLDLDLKSNIKSIKNDNLNIALLLQSDSYIVYTLKNKYLDMCKLLLTYPSVNVNIRIDNKTLLEYMIDANNTNNYDIYLFEYIAIINLILSKLNISNENLKKYSLRSTNNDIKTLFDDLIKKRKLEELIKKDQELKAQQIRIVEEDRKIQEEVRRKKIIETINASSYTNIKSDKINNDNYNLLNINFLNNRSFIETIKQDILNNKGIEINNYDKKKVISKYIKRDTINISESIISKPKNILTEPPFIFTISQREYFIGTTENPIIGTYGLVPCICICMRDPVQQKTMLAHIDSLTIDPLQYFFNYFDSLKSTNIDVFIIGADIYSKSQLEDLILQINSKSKYKIQYIWALGNGQSKSFGINTLTGEILSYPDSIYFLKKKNNFLADQKLMTKSQLNFASSIIPLEIYEDLFSRLNKSKQFPIGTICRVIRIDLIDVENYYLESINNADLLIKIDYDTIQKEYLEYTKQLNIVRIVQNTLFMGRFAYIVEFNIDFKLRYPPKILFPENLTMI